MNKVRLPALIVLLFLSQIYLKVNAQSKSNDLAQIAALKAKVEADPSNLKAHEAFIAAYSTAGKFDVTKEDPAIEALYKGWMKQFPKTFAIPFAIGKAYVTRENPKAKPFLLQASVLKPDQAEVWSLLANDAMFKNNITDMQEYLKKAVQYDPTNPDYAFYYASSFEDSDPARYDSLSLEVARKFPDSERGAQALYWLAAKSTIPAEKVAYYKQIYNRKSNQLFEWYLTGMLQYFDFLLKTDPDQAFELGLTMTIEGRRNRNLWKD